MSEPTPASDPSVVARRLHGHDPAHGHDTGGLPWAGRELTGSAFAGDGGAIDPALAEVLDARDAPFADLAEVELRIMAALAGARLLVPVVAVASDHTGETVSGLVGDAASDMATVVLTAPDGERALPAFASTHSLTRWNPQARPVPVTAAAAAQAALEEGCSVLVVDLADPGRLVVRSSQLWALAQQREWHHPAHDPLVRLAVRGVEDGEPDIERIDLAPGPHGSLLIGLVLVPGLTPARVEELTRAVAGALATEDVRIRLDAVRIALTSHAG